LDWLHAFFVTTSVPGIVRHFSLEEYNWSGDVVEIGTDASPWGLGGWLSVNGRITHYYHSPVTADDKAIFSLKDGGCEGQQLLEGLAILVAIRIWEDKILTRRISLKVRGDNIGALTLLIKMRPHSAQQAIIARELALAVSGAAFPPDVEHTPGIAHKVADGLSRLEDPSHQGKGILEHPALRNAVRTTAPPRHRQWYRALSAASPPNGNMDEEGDQLS
jgi:hypothetical protein